MIVLNSVSSIYRQPVATSSLRLLIQTCNITPSPPLQAAQPHAQKQPKKVTFG